MAILERKRTHMATKEQRGNGRVMRQYRSLVARLSVVALVVFITGAGLAAHGGGSASASANAAGGYKLAPAMMGGGASQPGANPNATLTWNLGNEVDTADPQVLWRRQGTCCSLVRGWVSQRRPSWKVR